jgi:hypothetical protein
MAELQLGMFAEVAINLLPIILIVADLLAIRADRQQAMKLLDLR